MYSKLVVMLLALTVPCYSRGFREPYGVKGDKLGESQQAWNVNNPHVDVCSNYKEELLAASPPDPDVIYCSTRPGENPTFANVPLKNITAWFFKGRLFKIEMDVWNSNWSKTVLSALVQEYGAAKVKRTAQKSGFGERFNGYTYIYTWENGVSTIEFSDNVPSVAVMLDGVNKEVARRMRQGLRSDI
jgi:hypothetical protein